MSYTNELIDRFKKQNKIESDYAAAKALGLRPNRISNYRQNVSHADDKTAVMLAEALGLAPFQVIARINEDRATDKQEKAFWRRFSAAAAIVLCVIPVLGIPQARAVSAVLNFSGMYIMSIRKWLRTLLGTGPATAVMA